MDWVPVIAGVSATVATIGRVLITIYALRGTEPEDRPKIIQALGKMFREARSLPPLRDKSAEPSAINSEQ
ncbi:hypothetical protein AB0E01_29760 [Nocardia vinacea]|uniref:hypothetical protein n=1 Tax=Nocardia vinacea TaxID=96468 RepID=UPI003405AA01